MQGNSSNRIYVWVAGIFVFLVIILWVLLLDRFGGSSIAQDPISEDSAFTPTQAVTPIEQNTPEARAVFINTKAGEPFEVDNFLQNPDTEQVDDDVFMIGADTSQNGDLYQIFFYRGGGINISLLDPNLAFARDQAETELRTLIPESDMRLCSLAISVTVPGWLSQQLDVDHSGIDYGLSFCPNGLPIN